jgi:hypothetical protein
MSKETDAKRTNTPERATEEEIRRMPALLDTLQAGSITGETALSVARACANGIYPAVKCGRSWRINKAAFLQVVGLA